MKYGNDDVQRILDNIYHGAKLISNYSGREKKITIICPKNHTYQTTLHNLQKGSRCPYCYNSHRGYGNDDVQKILDNIYPGSRLIGDYKNARTQITVQCPNGHIYKITLNTLQRGYRCSQCKRIDSKTWHHRFKKAHPTYQLLTSYTRAREKVKVMCDHGHCYWSFPQNVLNHNCPICTANGHKKLTQEQAKAKFYKLHPNWKFLSEYENKESNILVECEHGHRFKRRFSNLGYDRKNKQCVCPICNKQHNQSHGEQIIEQWLKGHHLHYVPEWYTSDLIDKRPLRYDFKVGNILIEFNGKQHYQPVKIFGGRKRFKVQNTMIS